MYSISSKKLEKRPGCIAVAAQILGDKWTPHLIRALASGTLRFSALQEKAGGVNPRTLSARLANLEAEDIIKKVTFPEVPPRTEYTLTRKGRDLLPIIKAMASWGDRYFDD